MSAQLVDSHCHLDRLDLSRHEGSLDHALDAARAVGVGHFLCVSIDTGNIDTVCELAQRYDDVSCSVGIHPNEREGEELDAAQLVARAQPDYVVAIGETGLDYFRSEGDLEWQRERFRRHIAAAREVNKPLIIHMRDASEDTLRIMREENARDAGGVMHCFVDSWESAEAAMDMDFMISFSGIVTFKNATDLQDVARRVPLERMLVETDSPYLAPVPCRGKSNEPAWVRHVAEFIAELRGMEFEELARITTENYFRTFGEGK